MAGVTTTQSTGLLMQHLNNSSEELAFQQFGARSVDLSTEETARGRRIRDSVIRVIESQAAGNALRLIAGGGFGAGSFGRKTQCKPLDDIDIYIVLNAGTRVMKDGVLTWRLEGNTPGMLETDLTLQDQGWVSAGRVLGRFVNQLKSNDGLRTADEIGANSKGKSAFLRFGDLNVDVTPVLYAKNVPAQYGVDRYFMPQGHGSPWWKATNPKEDQRRLSELNAKHNGLVLPAVRMMKWWNTNRNFARLKGIHVEVMVERAFSAWTVQGLAQAIHVCFYSLHSQVRAGCLDPTGLGPNLDTHLDWVDRGASFQSVDAGLRAAEGAVLCLSRGDVAAALNNWRAVFPL